MILAFLTDFLPSRFSQYLYRDQIQWSWFNICIHFIILMQIILFHEKLSCYSFRIFTNCLTICQYPVLTVCFLSKIQIKHYVIKTNRTQHPLKIFNKDRLMFLTSLLPTVFAKITTTYSSILILKPTVHKSVEHQF